MNLQRNEPDELFWGGYKIFQPAKGARFSMDAILLAHFVEPVPGMRIIDLGTGAGIIPLILSARSPQTEITAVELDPEQVRLLEKSIALNKIVNIETINADIREIDKRLYDRFDLVVMNPPYFTGQKVGAEQASRSIARHEEKIEIEEIVRTAAKLIKGRGRFALIFRTERLVELVTLLRAAKLEPRRLRFVHPQRSEKSSVFLLEAAKGLKPDLEILPPLFVRCENGEYSKEMLDYYNQGGETS